MTIHITQPHYDEIHVSCPYNADIVAALRNVPSAHWDRLGRVWVVNSSYDYELAFYLDEWRHETVWRGLENPLAEPSPPQVVAPSATPLWSESLFLAVGLDRLDSVFRAMSKVLHPDSESGDAELMRELIEGREAVKNNPFLGLRRTA